MLFELRRYTAQAGRRSDLVKMMEEEIIPFQASKGMIIVGSFVDEENPDNYVWMRRFDSEEHRKALYDAVYKSDVWLNDIAPRIPAVLIRESIIVHRLVPTSTSMLR